MRFLHKFNAVYDFEQKRHSITPSYEGEPYVALTRYTYFLAGLNSLDYEEVEYLGQVDLWNEDFTTNLGSVYLWYNIDDDMLVVTETNSLTVGNHWSYASFDEESGKYFTYSSTYNDVFSGYTIQSYGGDGENARVTYDSLGVGR